VTRQAAATNLFGSGIELYRFNVSADAAEGVALKKFVLTFAKATTSASTLAVSNFVLVKGSDPMNTADYQILDQVATDLKTVAWPVGNMTGLITVRFTNPQVVSAGGSEQYAIKADVTGSLSGDAVSIGLLSTGSTSAVTNYLSVSTASSTLSAGVVAGPNLSASAGGAAAAAGTFLWSDRSEVGGGVSTSGDWTDDLYVRDLPSNYSISRS
jgi:hypothetical protein